MVRFAPNWPARVVLFRVTGTALLLGAAVMWVVPGRLDDPDMGLFKLGISVFFFFCGLALLMRNHQDNQPDAYFDPIRHEVRVLQKDNRGEPRTILRRSYDSLGSVDFGAKAVALFDRDGSVLMRLAVEDADVRRALRIQLGGLVRLTEQA
jgi:hypothetical protein